MGDVLWNLEFALQLQESGEESGKGIWSEMDMDQTKYDDDNCKGKNNNKGFMVVVVKILMVLKILMDSHYVMCFLRFYVGVLDEVR